MPAFVPGRELSADFYRRVLVPALVAVPHSAALLGPGSDALGYDTPRSTDHDWGPRAQLFVGSPDVERARVIVAAAVPDRWQGWPTSMGHDGGPLTGGTTPLVHHVEVAVLGDWLTALLGTDPGRGWQQLDWLVTPQQRLLEITAGPVFTDPDGRLAAVRERLAWYPDQLWRWLLACQWHRVSEEEPFVQRAGEVGDDLGSAVVAARLVRDLMRLCLLMERRYAPYSKWLGTAFSRLPRGDALPAALQAAVATADNGTREAALTAAYELVAARHNALGLTPPLDPTTRLFHARPARVLDADRFAQSLLETVTDPGLRLLPVIGAIDQVVDSVGVLGDAGRSRALAPLWIR